VTATPRQSCFATTRQSSVAKPPPLLSVNPEH
jgi:hypothetical protein